MFAPVTEVYANEFSLIGGCLTDNRFLAQFNAEYAHGECKLTLPITPSLNDNSVTLFTSGNGSADACVIIPTPALENMPAGAKVLQTLGYLNAGASVYEDSLLVFSGTAELHGLVFRLVALHTALATGACDAAGVGGVSAWPATVYELLAAQDREVYIIPQANTLGQCLSDSAARAMGRACRVNVGTIAAGNVQLPNFVQHLPAAQLYIVGHAAIAEAQVNTTHVVEALTWLAGYMPDFPQVARDAIAVVASKCTFPSLQSYKRAGLGAYKEEIEAFLDEVDVLAQLKFFSADRNAKARILHQRHQATGKVFCTTVAQARLNQSLRALLNLNVDGVSLGEDDGTHFATELRNPLDLANAIFGTLGGTRVVAYDAGCYRHIYKRSATGTINTTAIPSSAGLSLLLRSYTAAKVTGGRGALTTANLVKMVLCSAVSLRAIADAATILCGVSAYTCTGWTVFNELVERKEDTADYIDLNYRSVVVDVSEWVRDIFSLAPYVPTGFPQSASFPGVIGGGDLESAIRPLPKKEWADICLTNQTLLKLLPEDRLHLTPFITSHRGQTRSQYAMEVRKWAEQRGVAGLEAASWLAEGVVTVTTLSKQLVANEAVTYAHTTSLMYEEDLFDGPVLCQSCGLACVAQGTSSSLSWAPADTFTLRLDGTYRFSRAFEGPTTRATMSAHLHERKTGGAPVYYAFITATFHTYGRPGQAKTLDMGTILQGIYKKEGGSVKLQGFMSAKESKTPAQSDSA